MTFARLSLICVTTLLVNGAYAKDFASAAGSHATTAELTRPAAELRAPQLQGLAPRAERAGLATARVGDEQQWLRISDTQQDRPATSWQPASHSQRWAF